MMGIDFINTFHELSSLTYNTSNEWIYMGPIEWFMTFIEKKSLKVKFNVIRSDQGKRVKFWKKIREYMKSLDKFRDYMYSPSDLAITCIPWIFRDYMKSLITHIPCNI